MQPLGSYSLSGAVSAESPGGDLRILMDTGIDQMILWLDDPTAEPSLASGAPLHAGAPFPEGVSVTISAPPADPVLQYASVTGDASQPMAPSQVEWRIGNGINTGRNVLAGADYLFDATADASGSECFRHKLNPSISGAAFPP
jgi:hypothetical protein